MSHETNRFPRLARFSIGTDPPLFETDEYTVPDPLESCLAPLDDLAMLPVGDFEDNESTTITRHRIR